MAIDSGIALYYFRVMPSPHQKVGCTHSLVLAGRCADCNLTWCRRCAEPCDDPSFDQAYADLLGLYEGGARSLNTAINYFFHRIDRHCAACAIKKTVAAMAKRNEG